MSSKLPSYLCKWIKKCMGKVLRMPPKNKPKDRKEERTICLVTIALDVPGRLPTEIVVEAVNQIRDAGLEVGNNLVVTDPRMDDRSFNAECKWATEAFHYTLEDLDKHELS